MPRPPDPGLQGQRQWLLVLTRLSIAPAETGRNVCPAGRPRITDLKRVSRASRMTAYPGWLG
jgi:hypothetical protein